MSPGRRLRRLDRRRVRPRRRRLGRRSVRRAVESPSSPQASQQAAGGERQRARGRATAERSVRGDPGASGFIMAGAMRPARSIIAGVASRCCCARSARLPRPRAGEPGRSSRRSGPSRWRRWSEIQRSRGVVPPGFELSAGEATRDRRRGAARSPRSWPRPPTMEPSPRRAATDRWQIDYFSLEGKPVAQAVVDDATGTVDRGLARPAGRGQARPRLRGRRRRQRQRVVRLDPALPALRRAVLRPPAPVPAAPPRPARPALVLALAVLLQQGRDRRSRCRSSTRCSATSSCACCSPGFRPRRARGTADPARADPLAGDRGGRPGDLPDRPQRRRLAGDRHRLRRGRRRRPDRRRRGGLRRRLHAADRPRRLLRPGQLPDLRPLRAGLPLGRRPRGAAGRARRRDPLRPRRRRPAAARRAAAARGSRGPRPRGRARLRLARLPVHALRAERQRRQRRDRRGDARRAR